jgi:metal-sulfur cluster biosynthetic enzyme
MLEKDQILEALSKVNDPELHRSLNDLKFDCLFVMNWT